MVRLIKIIIVLAALTLFGWTAWQNIIPGGVFEASYDFSRPSPFITGLLPGDRALSVRQDQTGQSFQPVVGEPVYFRLIPPRNFEKATVSVQFQSAGHPILEIGGLASRDPDIYDLKPLENKIIDELDWPAVWNAERTLYQRQPRYASVEAFLENSPPREKIVAYHARLEVPFRIAGYSPTAEVYTIDASLRGAHTFYVYVKNETLEVTFWVQDMNRDNGGDPVVITAYHDSAPVGTVSATDGESSDTGRPYPVRLTIPGLPEGAYRIEFGASRDVFIRQIQTRSKKFVAQNILFLGDEAGFHDGERPVTVWASGRILRALTLHADAAQELAVGDEVLRVAESHREYSHRIRSPSSTRVYSPRGDIELRTNGFFAFSPDALFAPEPARLAWDTDLDAEGIDYIIADYNPPQEREGWSVGHANFDLNGLLREGRAIPFVISAPGIGEAQNEVRIGEISVRLESEPRSLSDILDTILRFARIGE